jgi:hypothetical protein
MRGTRGILRGKIVKKRNMHARVRVWQPLRSTTYMTVAPTKTPLILYPALIISVAMMSPSSRSAFSPSVISTQSRNELLRPNVSICARHSRRGLTK